MSLSSPRSDQKFIESVLLYEVNNWTTIDEICENLRKLVGVISKSCSLLELSVESITKIVKDMGVEDIDSIQKKQNFIRSVFLYEFLIGEKDKDTIYKKMLRRIGSDLIDCPHFSNWYCQFKNGNYDFDDDSLTSEAPTFSDIPIEVLGNVIERSALKEQLCLRKVCRNLRTLVDKQKPAYKSIKVHIEHDHICVKFNDKYAVYCDEDFEQTISTESFDYVEIAFDISFNDEDVMYCDTEFDEVVYQKTKLIKSNDYVDNAFSDVAIALKNPKLQLELLEFDYLSSYDLLEKISGDVNEAMIFEKIKSLMESLNHKISVKEFSMITIKPNELISILQHLKPRVLNTISIEDEDSSSISTYHMNQIVALDQWKNAKDVTINARISSSSIEHFLRFERLIVNLHSISAEDLIRIRDEMLKSSDLQYLEINCDNMLSFAENERIFGLSSRDSQRMGVYQLLIPHSKEFFQFEMSDCSLSIERKSR